MHIFVAKPHLTARLDMMRSKLWNYWRTVWEFYIFPFKYYSLNTFVFKRGVIYHYIQINYFIIGNYLHWLALEIKCLSFTCFEWIHSHTHSLYNGEQLESRGASRPAWKFSATATRKMKCHNHMQMSETVKMQLDSHNFSQEPSHFWLTLSGQDCDADARVT